jgi:hypothetical protein
LFFFSRALIVLAFANSDMSVISVNALLKARYASWVSVLAFSAAFLASITSYFFSSNNNNTYFSSSANSSSSF